MKIGLNALSATIGGGVTFVQNLIPGLVAAGPDNEYIVYAAEEKYDDVFGSVKISDRVKIVKIRTYNLLIRIIQEQLLLPVLARRQRVDVLICPANILSFLAPCRKMLWILNIYMYFDLRIKGESLFERMRFYLLRFLTTLSIMFSAQSIHISNYSRETILNMGRLKTRYGRGRTIYLGADTAAFARRDGRSRADNYLFSVSSITRRKNYELLIKAYNLLPAALQDAYKLVLTGEVSTEMKEYLLSFAADKLQDRIVFTGKVDFERLCGLYQNASIFVLPSLVEAFGLPVIEAMAAGLPVLVANSTALPEIAGDAGLVFDPYDEKDLAEKINIVLSDEKLRYAMSLRGIERAKVFTWRNTSEKTLKYIDQLVEE